MAGRAVENNTWWGGVCAVADRLELLKGVQLKQAACVMGSVLVHTEVETSEMLQTDGPGSIRRTKQTFNINDRWIKKKVVITKLSPPLEHADEHLPIWEIKEWDDDELMRSDNYSGGYLPELVYEAEDIIDDECQGMIIQEINRYGELLCAVATAAHVVLEPVRPLSVR